MFEKLEGVEKRFFEIEKLLSNPEIVKDRHEYQNLIREHADLNKIVTVYREYKKVLLPKVQNCCKIPILK
jgi:peptide chain release factor 1